MQKKALLDMILCQLAFATRYVCQKRCPLPQQLLASPVLWHLLLLLQQAETIDGPPQATPVFVPLMLWQRLGAWPYEHRGRKHASYLPLLMHKATLYLILLPIMHPCPLLTRPFFLVFHLQW